MALAAEAGEEGESRDVRQAQDEMDRILNFDGGEALVVDDSFTWRTRSLEAVASFLETKCAAANPSPLSHEREGSLHTHTLHISTRALCILILFYYE